MADPATPTVVYCQRDEMGREVRTFAGVLANERQTACQVAASDEMVVADSSVLWPGMAVCCFGVAEGTYIIAIKDDTHVILSTDATETATGLTAIFKAFNPCPVSRAGDRGWWRNIISGAANSVPFYGASATGALTPGGTLSDKGIALIPSFTPASGNYQGLLKITGMTVKKSDELEDTPALRVKNESWGFWTLVCKGGHISYGPFDPDLDMAFKEEED